MNNNLKEEIINIAKTNPNELLNNKEYLGEMIKQGPIFIAHLPIDNAKINENIFNLVKSVFNNEELTEYVKNLENVTLSYKMSEVILKGFSYDETLASLIKDRNVKIEEPSSFYYTYKSYCKNNNLKDYLVKDEPKITWKESYDFTNKEYRIARMTYIVYLIITLVGCIRKSIIYDTYPDSHFVVNMFYSTFNINLNANGITVKMLQMLYASTTFLIPLIITAFLGYVLIPNFIKLTSVYIKERKEKKHSNC